jgi:putative transposase
MWDRTEVSHAPQRYSVEQIVPKLREAEKLQAQGQTIAQVCKRLGISDQTFYRWRIKYGALKEDEAQRLKALEAENTRLKKDRRRAGARHLRRSFQAENGVFAGSRRLAILSAARRDGLAVPGRNRNRAPSDEEPRVGPPRACRPRLV